MIQRRTFARPQPGFTDDDSGATLVEFAVVLALFLLIFFGLIDFGRLAFNYVTAQKAMQVASRVAAVRPPACPGVALVQARAAVPIGQVPPQYGTSCNAAAGICVNPGTVTCVGTSGNATAQEIWTLVSGGLPANATIANLQFSYSYDSNLGFLGGPYVPVVTVELRALNFEFVSPLGALAVMAGGSVNPSLGTTLPFPSMSVSMPGEDLAMGDNG